jgi:hypothetical protein
MCINQADNDNNFRDFLFWTKDKYYVGGSAHCRKAELTLRSGAVQYLLVVLRVEKALYLFAKYLPFAQKSQMPAVAAYPQFSI